MLEIGGVDICITEPVPVDLSGEDPPLLGQVDVVPRGQGPAPVEDDGVDATRCGPAHHNVSW